MSTARKHPLTRREVLAASGGLALAALLPGRAGAATPVSDYRLVMRPARVRLVGEPHGETDVWSFGGTVPGPEIRLRQDGRLRVTVDNRLGEETTVHWHGLRVPNAMDGVPHLTQEPIEPGGRFVYEFDCPDAGTYWYHPHVRGFEQIGRGLYGPLIVEEKAPPRVDRDVTWVLDDWRLRPDAAISGDFGNLRDMSHAGRIGNTVTVNGRVAERFAVRAGERIRLRLINTANARIFGLNFTGHRPVVVAWDGQPVASHPAAGGRVVLGPAMRADLVIDMTGKPGERFTVIDDFYRRGAYRLLDLVYGAKPLGGRPPEAVPALAPNTQPEPDPAAAERHRIKFGGGMMGAMTTAMMGGRRVDFREMMHNGKAWTVNGIAAVGPIMEPFLTLARGRSHILELDNRTAWPHPIHLHGHSFRVIGRNGKPTQRREWLDTVLMAPRERVEIAFVADNPGDWMFHCHIAEHMEGGMMGVIRVS